MNERPWETEPDQAQWTDEKTGLDCLIVRGDLGALSGYVGVPPQHPWHGMSRAEVGMGVEVHGNLTYSGAICFTPDDQEDAERMTQILAEGRALRETGGLFVLWWFGFDCAHAWDLVPMRQGLATILEEYGMANPQYRTFAYVRKQVTRLAAQLAAVA